MANLADSVREDAPKQKNKDMDYSPGSVFECAACLDVAVAKALLPLEDATQPKRRLAKICAELIGLRKSWSARSVCEEEAEYPAHPARAAKDRPIFHHERLDAYQVALDVIKTIDFGALLESFPAKVFQEYDEPATSMVLNIAEGNGRYAVLDHRRFLGIANRSAIRLLTLLDLGMAKGLWQDKSGVLQAKGLLERVAKMTRAMMKGKG